MPCMERSACIRSGNTPGEFRVRCSRAPILPSTGVPLAGMARPSSEPQISRLHLRPPDRQICRPFCMSRLIPRPSRRPQRSRRSARRRSRIRVHAPTKCMVYRRTDKVVRRLAQRHAAILGAAQALAAEAGMAGVQIASVAERAGIAAGTVYRYFPSKTDLIAELVAAVAGRELDAMKL